RPERSVSKAAHNKGFLVDFGKNTFGFLTLHKLQGEGDLATYYGESKEEALATETCETLDLLDVSTSSARHSTLEPSKAFRYVYITPKGNVQFDEASMQYEYLPVEERGMFRSSDDELNNICGAAKYTLELTSRQ